MKRSFPLFALILIAFLAGAFSDHLLEAISRDDIRSAAKVAGLEFTDSEIDSLLPSVEEELLPSYEQIRAMNIPNSQSPAFVFSPLPLGYTPPQGEDQVKISLPQNVRMPVVREKLAFYSIRELAALLRQGDITSLELTEFCLERLKKHDPDLQCVITLTEELAIAQAKRADAELAMGIDRGLLHGIPYGAKDLLAVQGYPTTWGAMPYKNQELDYDATVVQKLEEAGAVLVAKLTLGALAWGDVWFGGKTRNPWDTTRGSSGSSAGSASAVAAGLVPFAIGTETLGSIVSPSTVCGTTGLRPTFGRVSRHGAMALSWTMDKIGPICRSSEDCLLVLQAIKGADLLDRTVIDAPLNYRSTDREDRTIRIGYLAQSFQQDYPFKAQDSLTLLKLEELGYELVPIELPAYPPIGHILSAEAAAAFDELTLSNRDDELVRQIRNAWPNTFRQARLIPAVEYIQANRQRAHLVQEMEAVFEQVDLYVHPSWASPSLRITNYTGHPCLVLPNGFSEEGRPTSISFTGRLFDEGTLVAVGQAYQEATSWDDEHPQGF